MIQLCTMFFQQLMPQVLIYEHEGNWSKAVEGYDLLLRNKDFMSSAKMKSTASNTFLIEEMEAVASPNQFEYNKSLMRSLQQTGCDHILKMYCTGLSMERETLERNAEFQELQVRNQVLICVYDMLEGLEPFFDVEMI